MLAGLDALEPPEIVGLDVQNVGAPASEPLGDLLVVHALSVAELEVAREGYHDEASDDIELVKDCLLGQADLLLDLDHVDDVLALGGLVKHHLRDLLAEQPGSGEVRVVDHLANAEARGHLIQTVERRDVRVLD